MKRIFIGIIIAFSILLSGCAAQVSYVQDETEDCEQTQSRTIEIVDALEDWEQALLGAGFVRSRMVGDTLREYVQVVENGRAYELFVTHKIEDDVFYTLEAWLFISSINNGEYRYLDSFKIHNRQANAKGGLILLDIDFDGANDVLVWTGNWGTQGLVTYEAFLNRGDSYIATNFEDIPNPRIDRENQKIGGTIRNWAASHSYFIYKFIDGYFVRMDSFTREACRDTHEVKYIFELRDGAEVNEVYWYAESAEEIETLFYAENGIWGGGDFIGILPFISE